MGRKVKGFGVGEVLLTRLFRYPCPFPVTPAKAGVHLTRTSGSESKVKSAQHRFIANADLAATSDAGPRPSPE